MLRKLNSKSLGIAFVILLAIVILVTISDNKKGERSFKQHLVSLAPEEITSVKLFPRSINGEEIRLTKTGDEWEVTYQNKSYRANSSTVQTMLGELKDLKPISLVASSKERWTTFEVTDSLATRVEAYKGSKKIADLYIGKFKFSQPRNMSTYVRLVGDKDTYSVEGFLGMTFNKQVSDLRDKTLINSNKEDWTKLTFDYPDSSFVLSKENIDGMDKWTINGTEANQTEVDKYLGSIAKLSPNKLSNEELMSNEIYSLIIEGNNMLEPITVKCFDNNGAYYMESNQNKMAYFNDESSYKQLFIGASKLQ